MLNICNDVTIKLILRRVCTIISELGNKQNHPTLKSPISDLAKQATLQDFLIQQEIPLRQSIIHLRELPIQFLLLKALEILLLLLLLLLMQLQM